MITLDSEHQDILSEQVLHSWSSSKADAQKELQWYWSFRHEIMIIDGIVMKGRRIIILASLPDKALKQMYLNHIG